jgi:hypothetical protein
MVGTAQQAGVLKGNLGGMWASPCCTLWTTLQNLIQSKEGGQQSAVQMEERVQEELKGINAVLDGIVLARMRDPNTQYCVEQPATSSMRDIARVKTVLGEGIVVQGCAYGERLSGKKYCGCPRRQRRDSSRSSQHRGKAPARNARQGRRSTNRATPRQQDPPKGG